MAAPEGLVEGATRLYPPATNLGKSDRAPGTKDKGVPFYNPGMALNRDLSILAVAAEATRKGRELDFADALAGTGARSLRVAHEVGAPLIVHANDGDALAIAAMRRGATANAVPSSRLQATHGDAYAFLAARRYDIVDVDPYGSPMPFLDAAVRATRHAGLVCLTATDTGALAGTYPRACRRRYDAHHGLHAQAWRTEVGLRILAGTVVRAAARFDRVATPLLTVSHGHWIRVVARVEDGKRDADAALRHLGNLAPDPETGLGVFLPAGKAPVQGGWAGPLWTGPLHDAAFLDGLLAARPAHALACGKELDKLLPVLRAEAEAPATWLVPDVLQARFGPPPRRDRLVAALLAAGFRAARTHLDPQGIRTDAPLDAIQSCWRS